MKSMFAAVVLAFALCGCCTEKAALPGVSACWKVIGPEYVNYLNTDPTLVAKPEIRADRLKTAEMLSKVIAEATKAR